MKWRKWKIGQLCSKTRLHGIIELKISYSSTNHKNYNFLDCDWFKKLLFSANSIAKLLSDSFLLDSLFSDSLISQSQSKF